jgi:hypothetical protein
MIPNLMATPNSTAALHGATLKSTLFTLTLFSSPLPVSSLMAKALTDLSKLYSNKAKFGGEMYNILDTKLKIFYKMY